MTGVTSIQVQERLESLAEYLHQEPDPRKKERLQVLYWLKQENAPSISAIAKAIGRHRGTVQEWLATYREQGLEGMLEIKKGSGGKRVIPQWAEARLARHLEESEGFKSYGEVQGWLETTLGVVAEYHAVYQMTRYRLKARLKVPHPQNSKQDREPEEEG
ncbi:MAG: helix-turn-helix domain-containing protein [Kovacikia sp.]